jgi:hypothetical protein
MSTDSYLTEAEVDAIQSLHRDTPYLIRGISDSQFSPARYYGGMKFNGASYTYMRNTDEMVRDDVIKFVSRNRRAAEKVAKKAKQAASCKQPELFKD